jgi:hypothetical protein
VLHHHDVLRKPLFIRTNDISLFIDREKKVLELNDPPPYLLRDTSSKMRKRGMTENRYLFQTIIKRIGSTIEQITWRLGENKIDYYRWSIMFPKLDRMLLPFDLVDNQSFLDYAELARDVYFMIHDSKVKEWILEARNNVSFVSRLMDIIVINDAIKTMISVSKIIIHTTAGLKKHYELIEFSNVNILLDESDELKPHKTNILFIDY